MFRLLELLVKILYHTIEMDERGRQELVVAKFVCLFSSRERQHFTDPVHAMAELANLIFQLDRVFLPSERIVLFPVKHQQANISNIMTTVVEFVHYFQDWS